MDIFRRISQFGGTKKILLKDTSLLNNKDKDRSILSLEKVREILTKSESMIIERKPNEMRKKKSLIRNRRKQFPINKEFYLINEILSFVADRKGRFIFITFKRFKQETSAF